jgi:hypothetical protein
MTYSYAKAKQSFDLILKKACSDGKVRIKKDNQFFLVIPESKNTSPLDVKGVETGLSIKDIVHFIHEGRKP